MRPDPGQSSKRLPRRLLHGWLPILACLSAGLALPAFADCVSEHRQAEQALAGSGDLDQVLHLLERMQQAGCALGYTDDVKRMAADLAATQAQGLIQQDALDAAAERLARAPTSTWLTEVSAADIAALRKDWSRAAKRYNNAYTLMLDPNETPQRPQQRYIDRVRAQAGQALVLADDLSAVISRGDGTGQGIYGSTSKGHAPVPAPVRFETDSAELTALGQRQASMLAGFLKARQKAGSTQVTLIGHADERGDARYNQALSARRAEALKRFLSQQGVTLSIRTEGRGTQQPYVLPPGSAPMSNDERWALDRRVELRFD